MKAQLPPKILLLLLLVPCTALAEESCKVISDWHTVPEQIRTVLIREMGRIAERDSAFNPTDAVSDDTPRSRFFGACAQSDRIVVAIEQGGVAHALQFTEFSGGKKLREWYRPVPSGVFTPVLAAPPAER